MDRNQAAQNIAQLIEAVSLPHAQYMALVESLKILTDEPNNEGK